MSGYSLQQVFGANAAQDSNTVTINKSDLQRFTQFTPTDENDGESVFVAILLNAQTLGLTSDARDAFSDDDSTTSQQVAINPPITSLIPRQDATGEIGYFKRDSYTIDLDVELADVSPDLF